MRLIWMDGWLVGLERVYLILLVGGLWCWWWWSGLKNIYSFKVNYLYRSVNLFIYLHIFLPCYISETLEGLFFTFYLLCLVFASIYLRWLAIKHFFLFSYMIRTNELWHNPTLDRLTFIFFLLKLWLWLVGCFKKFSFIFSYKYKQKWLFGINKLENSERITPAFVFISLD